MSGALRAALSEADAFGATNSVVAPPVGTDIVTTGQLSPGRYYVTVAAGYGGTADVLDNMRLMVGSRVIMTLPVLPIANLVPQEVTLPALRVLSGDAVHVQNITAGGAGTVFRATVVATPIDNMD